MTLQEAKESVILAGKRLVESGLIARTWGNVSCRTDCGHFVITPSGRDYLTLTPEEIVEVAISDLTYQGMVKPSSEKGIHAEVYKLHSHINFVIHTHQDQASVVSVLEMPSIKVSKDYTSLKAEVVCADYGLPGTKKLRNGVIQALALSKGNAVIMKHHGALCYGASYEEAFQVAQELEDACKDYIRKQFVKVSHNQHSDPVSDGCIALSRLIGTNISPAGALILSPCESERISGGFRLQYGTESYDIRSDLSSLQNSLKLQAEAAGQNETKLVNEAKLHWLIYHNRKNINNIIHAKSPGIQAVSCAGTKVLPLLDDFAQIAGTCVRVAKGKREAIKALKSSSAVFLPRNGALCCGSERGDAIAVSMVAEKNSNALIGAAMFGRIKYINHLECLLMRLVYLKKYSKQASKK